jgi:acyl-coenzyme A thioesterase PaaI-like protein
VSDTAHDRMVGIGTEAGADDGRGAQVTHPVETRAAVDATRALIETLRVADAPTAALAEATELIARAEELLRPHRVEAMRMQGALRPERMNVPVQADLIEIDGRDPAAPAEFFPYSAIIGPLNPVAPPAELTWDGERIRGTATFGPPYVGPPGMVHGGIIALLFDEILGAANVCEGAGGFTGTLTVRYEAPTPLGGELELEGWVESIDGRKILSRGTISHAGTVTARAEGIFIKANH